MPSATPPSRHVVLVTYGEPPTPAFLDQLVYSWRILLGLTRGGQWTDPPIAASLRHVADRGFTRVVYYPSGFLADNAESELEGQMALANQPSLAAKHLPCLNDSRPLARALAQQVLALA